MKLYDAYTAMASNWDSLDCYEATVREAALADPDREEIERQLGRSITDDEQATIIGWCAQWVAQCRQHETR